MTLDERSPIADAALSVVLLSAGPSAPNLGDVLAEWATYLNGGDREYELILPLLVGDGPSSDWTGRYSRLRVLPMAVPAGLGTALRAGVAAARYPLLCYCLADGRFRPADLGRLLRKIDRVDLVCARREAKQAAQPTWGGRLVRWAAQWIFGIVVRDLECVFVLARRALFARIPIQSEGPFAHVEVLAKANFLGALLDEAVVAQRSVGSQGQPLGWGQAWADGWRLFSTPDFGPVDANRRFAEPTADSLSTTSADGSLTQTAAVLSRNSSSETKQVG
jgi:glycosyltransferase involved in cell wall biosynthesis